jgi:hypothetical protein
MSGAYIFKNCLFDTVFENETYMLEKKDYIEI